MLASPVHYPFPRHRRGAAPCAPVVPASSWPAANAAAAAASPLPPASVVVVQQQQQPPWPPGYYFGAPSTATRRPPPDANDEVVELNDDLIALFAGMEARRAARGSSSKAARRRAASSAAASTGHGAAGATEVARFKLPAQEDAASRAAQHERRDRRARGERLYGVAAAEVRELEALCNVLFDRAVREHNPPMWPSVALR